MVSFVEVVPEQTEVGKCPAFPVTSVIRVARGFFSAG